MVGSSWSRILSAAVLAGSATPLASPSPTATWEAVGAARDRSAGPRRVSQSGHKGDAAAQFSPSGMYAAGLGAEPDEAQCIAWLRKAADQGYAPAQGVIYEWGLGVERDEPRAVALYRKAAKEGISEAQTALSALSRGSRRSAPGTVEYLVCGVKVTPMEDANGDREGRPGLASGRRHSEGGLQ
jgi:TPR repeat protein